MLGSYKMTTSSICFAALALATSIASNAALAQEADAVPAKGKLVWQDNFDGTSLNYSKWGIEVNAFGGGNNELQIYTDRKENIRVEEGNLVIELHRGPVGISGTEREYSSGRVRSKNRGDWKYGRIEVRAKLPVGAGVWPAIWMLPTDDRYGGWALSGEIDIMEYRGQEPNKVLGTLHYGGAWPKNESSGDSYTLTSGNFNDDFHTFAVDWREGQIQWFVDGHLYQTQKKWNSAAAAFPAPFDQRFHLLLNLSAGGGFVGPPNQNTQFPQKFLVDYVRVYQ